MITIEKLSTKNIDAIAALVYEFQEDHLQQYGSYYSLIPHADTKIQSIISSSIKKRNMCIYIGYVDNTPAGYIFLKIDSNIPIYSVAKYGYISGLYIRPSFRSNGIAKALFQKAVVWFKAKGMKKLELKVNVGNKDGMKFWKKNGFTDQQMLMVKEL